MGLLERVGLVIDAISALQPTTSGDGEAVSAERLAALAATTIWRGDRLLHGVVRGQRWVHNPAAPDALALLSKSAEALLDCADGRNIGAIAAALTDDIAGRRAIIAAAPLLLRNGFVRGNGPPLARSDRPKLQAPPERVFDLWLHLTNHCNLDCPYCYIHKGPQHMGQAAMVRVLGSVESAAAANHCDRIHVRYAGGEPMLRFAALKQFHAEATARCERHGKGYSAAILTNGTVVPDGAPQWVRAHGVGVSVSMDGLGATQDTMRPTRNGRGSWHHLERGLDAWQQGGVRPYVLVTIGDHNLDEVPTLVDFLITRGLGFRLSLVRDLEWGAGTLDDIHGAERRLAAAPTARYDLAGVLQGEALQRVRGRMMEAYDRIEAAVGAAVDAGRPYEPSFRATHRFCDLSPWRPVRKACGAGSSYAAISQEGTLSPCQAALHHESEVAVIDGAQSIVELGRSHKPFGAFDRAAGNSECNRCRHQASCAAGCPLLLHRRDGHVDGRSPYCEVFRAVLPRIVSIAALELWGEAQRSSHARPSAQPQQGAS